MNVTAAAVEEFDGAIRAYYMELIVNESEKIAK